MKEDVRVLVDCSDFSGVAGKLLKSWRAQEDDLRTGLGDFVLRLPWLRRSRFAWDS